MALDIILWILQGWLAAAFLIAGGLKLALRKEALEQRPAMGYVADRTATEMKLIGLAEVLGAIGLVVPWVTGIARMLTPLAAACLAILMAGAVLVHLQRREPFHMPFALLALCAFIAVGRWGWLL